jgi:hypothetical protein
MQWYDSLSYAYGFVRDWQTLIAGIIAFIAAVMTVSDLRRQAREAAERKARAARAMLPSTLDSLDNYALECIRWLKEVEPKAKAAESGLFGDSSIPVNQCPRPDTGMMRTLAECVANLDIAPARFIDDLLARLQVQHSRIASLYDYFKNHQLYSVKQLIKIEDHIANAVEISALARNAYPFARKQTEETPRGLDFAAVTQAFQACHLDASRDVYTWNILSNRYLNAGQG